jgi:hypothetical protein
MNFNKWANILKIILLKIVEEIERRINLKNGVDTSDSFSSSLYTSLKFIVLDQVDGLVDEVIGYSKSQVHSLSDMIAQKVSILLSSLVYVLIMMALIGIAFLFFSITLSLYLGDVLGKTYLGFMITGGFTLFLIVILYFIGHKSIAQAIKKQLTKMM